MRSAPRRGLAACKHIAVLERDAAKLRNQVSYLENQVIDLEFEVIELRKIIEKLIGHPAEENLRVILEALNSGWHSLATIANTLEEDE